MKSPIQQLSVSEREALASLYDTEYFRVLRKLIDIERIELAKDHVDQTDILQIRYLSGQTASLKKLVGTIRSNFKDIDKKSWELECSILHFSSQLCWLEQI